MTQNSNDTGLFIHISSFCDWSVSHLFNITFASGKIELYLVHTTLGLLFKKTLYIGDKISDTFLRGIVVAPPLRTSPKQNANVLCELFGRDLSLEKEITVKLFSNDSLLMR